MKKLSIFLAILLVLSLVLCGCSIKFFYPNEQAYSIGNFTYDSSKIKEVDIDWIAGEIDVIISSENGQLSVSESGTDLTENQKMRYLISNGKLTVKFWKSRYDGNVKDGDKNLTVYLPKDVDLKINGVSCKISINDGSLDELEVSSVSGAIVMGNVEIKNDLSLSAVSGSILAEEIKAHSLEVSCTSGNVNVKKLNVEDEIEFSAMSGNVDIGLVKARALEISTMSGDVIIRNIGNYNIPTQNIKADIFTDGYTQGDQNLLVEITTMSGDVYLRNS